MDYASVLRANGFHDYEYMCELRNTFVHARFEKTMRALQDIRNKITICRNEFTLRDMILHGVDYGIYYVISAWMQNMIDCRPWLWHLGCKGKHVRTNVDDIDNNDD